MSSFVSLVAEGGFTFVIPEEAAHISGYLQRALEGDFLEGQNKTIELQQYSPPILDVICKFLMFKYHYQNSKSSKVPDFANYIDPVLALQLLVAADYLDL